MSSRTSDGSSRNARQAEREYSGRAFSRRQIVFFHPDLGIGGAERLVCDAALSLQELGHKVTIFTSHCDKNHCFDEARDGTLDVRVRGSSIFPHSIFGRFSILCAILRQIHLVLQITAFTKELEKLSPEICFFDQLSACIPLLRQTCPRARILFYCHFPDKLLAQRGGILKAVYRWPFDWIENWSTGASDVIVVNSNFTKSIFGKAFPGLFYRSPRVVYPCVDVEEKDASTIIQGGQQANGLKDKKTFLSINRFERKKDVALALKAYARLSEDDQGQAQLIIAGGYDRRISENVTCYDGLVKLADSLKLKHATLKDATNVTSLPSDVNVLFLLSIPDSLKIALLHTCTVLVYTPSFEHFGIVPLEAMLAEKPVLAANLGGPKETVVDGETGWLRDPMVVEEWTEVMASALRPSASKDLQAMGEAGHKRVVAEFSKQKMAQRLNEVFDKMLSAKTRPVIMSDQEVVWVIVIVLGFSFLGLIGAGLVLRSYLGYKQGVNPYLDMEL